MCHRCSLTESSLSLEEAVVCPNFTVGEAGAQTTVCPGLHNFEVAVLGLNYISCLPDFKALLFSEPHLSFAGLVW